MREDGHNNSELKPRIFGSDRITINERHTFRKSDIQGITSDWHTPTYTNTSHFRLYVIISGNKILVDTTKMLDSEKDIEIYGGRERQLDTYHKKWEEDLSNIGQDPKPIKKERKEI